LTRNFVRFPEKATAGLNFQAALDYTAGWALTALLRGPAALTLEAVADGGTYTFAAKGADTATWAPGLYGVSVRAALGDDVVEIYAGQLNVLPDLASIGAGFDPRSANERALDAINAVLGKKASQDQMRYRINNRELWRMPVADLLKLKSMYTVAVRRERRRQQGCSTFGRAIPVVFR
jgi:hypothetical protein